MSFDMAIFGDMIVPTVVAACLILGFILKKWVNDLDNKWIPTVLTAFGAVLACAVKSDVSAEVIISGAFSGLASTGLHQAFKQLINEE